MDRFWPGPLTLLLPRTPAIPDLVTAGRPLVGVRIPAHPVALALLAEACIPIAAPSANTFSHTSPTTAAHVLADLDGRIDAILDGGPTTVGLESTVAEITKEGITIYRPGAVTAAMLAPYAPVHLHQPGHLIHPPESLPSPGVGIRHYAPRARLVLLESDFANQRTPLELAMVSTIDSLQSPNGALGIMLPDEWNRGSASLIYPWGPWHAPEVLASGLYAGLRWLDEQGATTILCPVPESQGIAQAMHDRLRKAAQKQ